MNKESQIGRSFKRLRERVILDSPIVTVGPGIVLIRNGLAQENLAYLAIGSTLLFYTAVVAVRRIEREAKKQ